MISFTRAVEVPPGERIASRQHNLLARAINERILSGLGDATFRIAEYMLGLFRAVVMGDDEFLNRSEVEFFDVYQHVRPNVANWPEGGVDPVSGLPEPSGPNISNPIMAWVYGRKAYDLDPESQRLNRVSAAQLGDSPEVVWNTAKLQRGAVDPDTGMISSPVRDLAWEFNRLAYTKGGLMGTSYGGFLPGPDRLTPACVSPCNVDLSSCNQFARENLDIYFTATRPDVDTSSLHFDSTELVPWAANPSDNCVRGHYAGTCIPCIDWDPTPGASNRCPDGNYGNHIAIWFEVPAGFEVMLNDGTIDHLPHNDWVEGPYTSVLKLSRDIGYQLSRAINLFNAEFRGSDAQREGWPNHGAAFDAQSFYMRQYSLAPARAIQAGTELHVQYPAWSIKAGTWPKGTKLTTVRGGTTWTWSEGFVATHAFCIVRATGKQLSLLVRHAGGVFILSAGENGAISRLPVEGRLVDVSVELLSDVTLVDGESIQVEMTELQAYKPNWWDLYAVLRKGGAKLVGATGGEMADAFVDGQGVDEDRAALISRAYRDSGCIVNQHEVTGISDPTAANENAVFESARRLSRAVRILNRFSLVDYAVIGGNSVLWFTPHPRTSGHPMTDPRADGDPDVDMFEDLFVAPAANGSFGSRWVLDVWLRTGSESESSLFKFDAYTDQFADINRCMFLDATMTHDKSFVDQINRGQDVHSTGSYFAQAPSGWNYAQLLADRSYWINHAPGETDEDRTAFCKSCRIYEPPVEIKSIERVVESARSLVKVTLRGRLHNTNGETSGAPDDVPRSNWVNDPDLAGPWDWATINGEPYRTTENALRAYLFYRWGWHAAPSPIIGDASITGIGFDGRMASIYPSFIFVRLIPEAPVDSNDDQTPGDAPLTADAELQAEWYLRCMSEGYVAGAEALNCADPDSSRMYDWAWPNLCTHLFGSRSVSAFASKATKSPKGAVLLRDRDVRPDMPEGFGPLPDTKASSEVFNRLVRIVNSLNRVRVMLPWEAEVRQSDVGLTTVDAAGGVDYGCGTASSCSATASGANLATNTAPAEVGAGAWGSWGSGLLVESFTAHNISACSSSPGTPWAIASTRQDGEFRFNLVDWTIYQHAIPEAWRDMFSASSDSVGAMFQLSHQKSWYERRDGSTTCGTHTTHTFDCELVARTWEDNRCVFLRNGTFVLTCGERPIGGWAYYWDNTTISPGDVCGGGSLDYKALTVLDDTTPVLDIPVVERGEQEITPWLK